MYYVIVAAYHIFHPVLQIRLHTDNTRELQCSWPYILHILWHHS